ncbi:MAG: signal peptidase II [Patescibacteria group bacterium]
MKKYFFIAAAILIFDRILKILSARSPGKIFLIPDVLSFDYYLNRGLAFSIRFPRGLTIFISLIFLALIVYFVRRAYAGREPRQFFFWLLIFFGAGSNFFDRAAYGGTIDYLNFFGVSFVNLADGMILAGIIILLFKIKKSQIQISKSQINSNIQNPKV